MGVRLCGGGAGGHQTVGDLAGPMAFAALMGTARLIYGKWGHKLHLEKCMLGSSLLCVAAYLAIALVPNPLLSLVGCAVCGFSVGILWPGTFSKGSAAIPKGGTVMFALFALAGDLGCSAGPTLAGMVTRVCDGNMREDFGGDRLSLAAGAVPGVWEETESRSRKLAGGYEPLPWITDYKTKTVPFSIEHRGFMGVWITFGICGYTHPCRTG